MEKIVRIELTPLHVPFREYVRKAMGESQDGLGMAIGAEEAWLGGDFVICKLISNSRKEGVGEIFVWLPETGVSPNQIIEAIQNGLKNYILGESPFNIEKINHRMDINIARSECAKGILDMACYDLMGKILDKPIYELIGGTSVSELQNTALIPLGEPMLMKGLVRSYYKKGYRSFRLKLGNGIQEDKNVLKAIRKAFGNKITIRVDYNQAYTPQIAVRAIKAIEPYGIEYAEQPVRTDDFLGLAYVQKRVTTPLMVHESFFTLQDFTTLVELSAVEVLGINSERPGGITKALKAINYAKMRGLGIVLHNQPLGIASAFQIHLGAACYHQITYPMELFGQEMMEDDLIEEPIDYSNGMIQIPEGPGWGVTLDEKALKRYATAPTTIIK
ncbi:MAG: mandelate racemase/muconate lactonizing enzyme family protein [Promethearchaeota archaeon]